MLRDYGVEPGRVEDIEPLEPCPNLGDFRLETQQVGIRIFRELQELLGRKLFHCRVSVDCKKFFRTSNPMFYPRHGTSCRLGSGRKKLSSKKRVQKR